MSEGMGMPLALLDSKKRYVHRAFGCSAIFLITGYSDLGRSTATLGHPEEG